MANCRRREFRRYRNGGYIKSNGSDTHCATLSVTIELKKAYSCKILQIFFRHSQLNYEWQLQRKQSWVRTCINLKSVRSLYPAILFLCARVWRTCTPLHREFLPPSCLMERCSRQLLTSSRPASDLLVRAQPSLHARVRRAKPYTLTLIFLLPICCIGKNLGNRWNWRWEKWWSNKLNEINLHRFWWIPHHPPSLRRPGQVQIFRLRSEKGTSCGAPHYWSVRIQRSLEGNPSYKPARRR